MESVLKRYFGYSEFRPYQKEIIQQLMAGRDTLVVMATGSGKSICYQIPPLVGGKIAIVISPLIALMQDQVMGLKHRGIKAEYLGSNQTNQHAFSEAERGSFNLLYMTPEKALLLPERFWKKLSSIGICLLAVDEAHCISEWGHDFRREYKQLYKLHEFLPNVPFVGLTATATEKVQRDIILSLKMKDAYVALGSFDRQNLFYGVKSFSRTFSFVKELVGEILKQVAVAGSTIVYCTTVKETEQIFTSLKDAGMKVGMYHGQMGTKAREESHRAFTRDELHVMVATIAFGMGIDKPDIRCVIHYGCPKSLESYYQESGRCGRDGLQSVCWLYYSRSDFAKGDFYCAGSHSKVQRTAIMESLMAAERYCLLSTCRRRFLLEYFGEKVKFNNCGNCDICTGSKMQRDLTRESFLLVACIKSCGGRWGLNMPIDVLRGSRSKRIHDCNFDNLPLHGMGKMHSPAWWKALSALLMVHGYLKEFVHDAYRLVSVSTLGEQFLSAVNSGCQSPLVLTLTREMIDEEGLEGVGEKVEDGLQTLSASEFEDFSEAEMKLYQMLIDMRMKLAKNSGTAPYAVCGDLTIRNIAKLRPSTRARLANMDGINQHLMHAYGDNILQAVSHMSQELGLPLDGKATIQTVTKKDYANSQRKLTSAKLDAWKMWQGDSLSLQEVANHPGRAAPIKESTVLSYILEAAQEGCEVNWSRLCDEIGLTGDIISGIAFAIKTIGSRDRLKPIKEELPDHVTYEHIRTCLAMEDHGSLVIDLKKRSDSPEMDDSHSISETPESFNKDIQDIQECETNTGDKSSAEGKSLSGEQVKRINPSWWTMSSRDNAVLQVHQETNCSSQILKHQEMECSSIHESPMKKTCLRAEFDMNADIAELVATKAAILEWLEKHDGVNIAEIVNHFKGSSRESVLNILGNLEADFLIFRKNDLYRIM